MLDSQLLPIKSWTNNGMLKFCVGCDVGGSGFRLRLTNYYNKSDFVDLKHVKTKSTAELLHSFSTISQAIKRVAPNAQSTAGCIAVAGPISNDTVVFTNWPGKIPERTLQINDLPQDLFPKKSSMFLNDLEAGAYGVIAAEENGTLDPCFNQLWPETAPKGKLVSDTRTAVLAMGTGLGVAVILKNPTIDQPIVIPSELGHLQIPTVCLNNNKFMKERSLIQYISDRQYEGCQMPEFEDIASGRGLKLAYQYEYERVKQIRLPLEKIDGGEIAMNAKKGDKIARKALLYHYIFFMRAAKAVATTLQCDSVLLALDNQVKNDWFVRSIFDELREEFYQFIRPSWMKNIRVYSQIKTLNFNILGTTYKAQSLSK